MIRDGIPGPRPLWLYAFGAGLIREGAMGAAVRLRTDFSAGELRLLAKRAEDADQVRRLLSLAAVLDGMSRKAAAEIGAMDRQTLCDWAHRCNGKLGTTTLRALWLGHVGSRRSTRRATARQRLQSHNPTQAPKTRP